MERRSRLELVRAASDPAPVMQRIVEQAIGLVVAAEGAAVALAFDGVLTYACTSGSLASSVGLRLDMDASLAGLSVRTGRTLRSDECAMDERVDREAASRLGIASIVAVPLCRARDAVGVLQVVSGRPRAFGEADVRLLTRLADFVTTVITLARELGRAAEDLLAPHPASPEDTFLDADAISAFVASVVYPQLGDALATRERVAAVIEQERLEMVLQPIVDLESMTLAGSEALARFTAVPPRGPQAWFAEARRAGLGVELQVLAARRGLAASSSLPPGVFLSLNLDAEALASPEVAELVEEAGRAVVLELTEHVEVEDYPALRRRLAALREKGARLAIDDTGAGYSSFSHLVKLAPEFIKLDIELIQDIDLDPVRRSLVMAVVAFANETGATVIAEGIETTSELRTLRGLSVRYGQGYLLGRPAAPEQLATVGLANLAIG